MISRSGFFLNPELCNSAIDDKIIDMKHNENLFRAIGMIFFLFVLSMSASSESTNLSGMVNDFLSFSSSPDVQTDEMLANINPFLMGTVSAGINKVVSSGINPKDFTVILEPRTGYVRLCFNHDGNSFSMPLNAASRQIVIDAVMAYNKAFDARSLEKKNRYKHLSAFGKMDTQLEMGNLLKVTCSHPKPQLGYKFVESAPYFTIFMPATTADEDLNRTRKIAQSTPEITLFFNRAQADILIGYLQEDKIKALVAEKNVPTELTPAGSKSLNAPDAY